MGKRRLMSFVIDDDIRIKLKKQASDKSHFMGRYIELLILKAEKEELEKRDAKSRV